MPKKIENVVLNSFRREISTDIAIIFPNNHHDDLDDLDDRQRIQRFKTRNKHKTCKKEINENEIYKAKTNSN